MAESSVPTQVGPTTEAGERLLVWLSKAFIDRADPEDVVELILATEQEAAALERRRIRAGIDRYGRSEVINPDGGSGRIDAYFADDVDAILEEGAS